MSRATLTVVICTYQRPQELTDCLTSLQNQQFGPEFSAANFEVLVVDNEGNGVVRSLAHTYGAEYVIEAKTGLSHARNRGAEVAKTPWLLYLDDDAKARPNLISQTLRNIRRKRYKLFGGRFEHWHKTEPPKWFPVPFESDGRPVPAREFTELKEDEYLFGGIMAVERDILLNMGGFDPQLGMQGKRLAYGEENDLQHRLRKAGHKIAYDPDMVIDHLVANRKYQLAYHLRSAYRHGLYNEEWLSEKDFATLKFIKEIFWSVTVFPAKAIGKLILRKGYYWQNVVIEVGGRWAYLWGSFRRRWLARGGSF